MFFSGCFKKPGLSRIYRWRKTWLPNTKENVLEFHCLHIIALHRRNFMIFQTALLFHQDRVLTKNPPPPLNTFILFILAVLDLQLLRGLFSGCGEHWLLSLWRARFLLAGFSCRARALRSRAPEARLPSSRAQAQ